MSIPINPTANTLPIKTQFSTFLISHLKLICSFIFLFIATSLLLVALIIHDKFSTLLSLSFDYGDGDGDGESEELFYLENFEAYRVLFDESLTHNVEENQSEFLEEKSDQTDDKNSATMERSSGDWRKEIVRAQREDSSPIRNASKAAIAENWEHNLGSHGCREMHQVVDEGMDLLWEVFEMETLKNKGKQDNSKKKTWIGRCVCNSCR